MASTEALEGESGAGLMFNISATERETGLSKDVLRMWERRYGFPQPSRDANGERQYTPEDIAKLRAIKRLMDVGGRPGKLMQHSLAELNGLADARAMPPKGARTPAIERDVVDLLQAHDTSALQHLLANLLMKQGLQRFVLDTATLLNRAVGDAWMRGELHVFEEHVYTELLQVVLRTAINAFPRQPGVPRALLTTFPGEQHALGLLMVEALLVPEGVHCISLGPQTPLDDIRRAALAHNVHVLALSFSTAFPLRQATDGLAALRRQLPPQVAIWCGGELMRRIRRTLVGVALLPDLPGVLDALHAWRTERVPAARGY